MKRTLGVSIVLMGMLSPAAALDKYLCLATKSTGFSLEKSKWEATRFDVSERRYLVQEIPERDGMMKRKINFVVRAFGEDREKFECYRSPDSDRVICGGLGRGMIVDTKSLRYQELYGFGYLEGDDKPGNTPALTIGSCTKID